ncbi:MAG: TolC family protein [Bacteroidota bacterium]
MRFFLSSFILFFSLTLGAQGNSQWTLEGCVNYALENNLQVRQLQNQAKFAELDLKRDKWSRLPSLSGRTSYGVQLGRTIDPTTNTFEQQNIGFNSYSIDGNIVIYNGNRINNSIQQSNLNFQAAELEAEDTGYDVALDVANRYLTVLLTREQLNNARAQLQLTDDQLAQTDAAIQAGSLPEAERYDLIAQQAANQSSIVDLENQVQLALVNLQLTLELDPSDDFNIITPDLEISQRDLVENYSFEEVYLSASTTQPTLRAADLRRSSAALGKEVAKAGFYPTLSVFGSLSTNYSSIARNAQFTGFELGDSEPVVINGEEATIAGFEPQFNFSDQPFFDQLNQNFGQTIGLSLNVPIYSQGRNQIAVQQAEINRQNADIQYQQAVNTLQSEVTQALTNLRAARQSYQAAETSFEASERAYEVAKRRYELGASNNLDLITAANRLESARIERTRSKYQLIFNQQVIQFYLGQPLKLN